MAGLVDGLDTIRLYPLKPCSFWPKLWQKWPLPGIVGSQPALNQTQGVWIGGWDDLQLQTGVKLIQVYWSVTWQVLGPRQSVCLFIKLQQLISELNELAVTKLTTALLLSLIQSQKYRPYRNYRKDFLTQKKVVKITHTGKVLYKAFPRSRRPTFWVPHWFLVTGFGKTVSSTPPHSNYNTEEWGWWRGCTGRHVPISRTIGGGRNPWGTRGPPYSTGHGKESLPSTSFDYERETWLGSSWISSAVQRTRDNRCDPLLYSLLQESHSIMRVKFEVVKERHFRS